MKKCFFSLAVFLLIFGFWIKLSKSQYISIPISFSEGGFPLVKVKIENKEYPFILALSQKYPLSISSEILNEIKKIEKGMAQWKNIKGEQQQSLLFEIPHVLLENIKIKKLFAHEDEKTDGIEGFIKWPLDKMNILLDFPHCKAYGIKNEKCLNELGVDLKKMEKIKCNINGKGIHLNVNTPLGPTVMNLITNCVFNLMDTSLLNEEKNKKSFLENITIGNREFEEERFYPYKIAPELELDGILGVQFLRKHIVYIDAQNEYLYIGEEFGNAISEGSLFKVPVGFTVSGLPVVDIEVEKKIYKTELDLGCSWELFLPPQSFSFDGRPQIDKSNSMNAYGEKHEVDCYSLSECRIGNKILKNLFVSSMEGESSVKLDLKSGNFGEIDSEELALIGIPLLQRTNIYFDFPQRGIWLVDRKENLKKIGVQYSEYERVPFEIGSSGLILLKIENDLGVLRFLLDTGASISLIHTSLIEEKENTEDSCGNICYATQKFVVGNSDYGEKNLYPFELNPSLFDFDGVLGMDFFRGCPFYIDYPNRVIYFQKPRPDAKINLQ